MLRVVGQQCRVRLQADATIANNVGSCSMLYPFAYSQQHATTCNGGCIRTQSVTFNNVGSRWPTLLRRFARGFKLRTCKRTQQLPTMLEVVQCCIRLQVAKSLSGFKLCAATPDNTLQHAIGCANGRKVWHSTINVGCRWPTMLRPFVRASCMSWITSVAGTILKTLNQCPWYVSIRLLSQFNKCLLLFKSTTFKMTKFDKNWSSSFRFCFRIWIFQSRWGLSNKSPNLHKKTMNLRILVVVLKLHHHAIVPLSVVQSVSRS